MCRVCGGRGGLGFWGRKVGLAIMNMNGLALFSRFLSAGRVCCKEHMGSIVNRDYSTI